jgi:hypothetical protein
MVRNEINDEIQYNKWIDDLATNIFILWTDKLGPGPNGTDASNDIHAWLCLSRTVRFIGHEGYMPDDHMTDNKIDFPCTVLQFALARYALSFAFESTGVQDDESWLAQSVGEKLQNWGLARKASESGPWQVLATAAASLQNVRDFFPANEPTKCYAVVEIATVCFTLAVCEIQQELVEVKIFDSKIEKKSPVAEVSEKQSLFAALNFFEDCNQRISKLTRDHLLQNKCFILSSTVIECMRNYSRLLKTRFAPSDKRQVTMDAFFPKNS